MHHYLKASLSQGLVPTDWKAARVLPLFKKGKTDDLDNYRPISIFPAVSKVMERAAHLQLCSHLSEHKILSPYQFGFRKAHSTEFATISLTDTIRRNIDQGLLTEVVFIDLRKAFDTVDHAVLLKKLHSLGIPKQEPNWFEDYLSDRLQVVGYQNVPSEPELLTSGVPG